MWKVPLAVVSENDGRWLHCKCMLVSYLKYMTSFDNYFDSHCTVVGIEDFEEIILTGDIIETISQTTELCSSTSQWPIRVR